MSVLAPRTRIPLLFGTLGLCVALAGSVAMAASADAGPPRRAPADRAPALRPTTPEEARQIAAALGQLLDRPSEDLEVLRLANGARKVAFEGRFQNAAVATVGPDGKLVFRCFDSTPAAETLLAAPTPAPER